MPGRMENSENHDGISLKDIKNPVFKATGKDSPDVRGSSKAGIEKWIFGCSADSKPRLADKIFSQTGL
jgi:hypothetical protein